MKSPNLTAGALLSLLNQQGFKCALTGRELTPENCTLDHKIPVSKGGQHDINNAQLVCWEANKARGTFSIDEFIQLCRDVVNAVGGQ